MPTPEVERIFMRSFNIALTHYGDRLDSVSHSSLTLPDINFDTGRLVQPAVYSLADKTYAELIERLAKKNFTAVDETLKENVLSYYADFQLPFATKKDQKKWQRLQTDLEKLRCVTPHATKAAR